MLVLQWVFGHVRRPDRGPGVFDDEEGENESGGLSEGKEESESWGLTEGEGSDGGGDREGRIQDKGPVRWMCVHSDCFGGGGKL